MTEGSKKYKEDLKKILPKEEYEQYIKNTDREQKEFEGKLDRENEINQTVIITVFCTLVVVAILMAIF